MRPPSPTATSFVLGVCGSVTQSFVASLEFSPPFIITRKCRTYLVNCVFYRCVCNAVEKLKTLHASVGLTSSATHLPLSTANSIYPGRYRTRNSTRPCSTHTRILLQRR